MEYGPVIPVLRIFDIGKAREFYVGFLGGTVDWEHRFEPALPLYMQLSLGQMKLHLSEHHGDACPGACIRVAVSDIAALHADFSARNYGYARPGIETKPWGLDEMSLVDPFGNRVIFFAPAAGSAARPAERVKDASEQERT